MISDDREQQLLVRIKQLEVGLRRAIHLIETQRGYVMWPIEDDNFEEIYTAEWASIMLEQCKEALKGKADD